MRAILAAVAGILALWLVIGEKPWVAGNSPATSWKLSQYIAVYLWIAAALNLALAAILFLTAHWWARPMSDDPTAASISRQRSVPVWFWPLVAAAMGLNAWLCGPRLWQSFWHDETYPLRNAILGVYTAGPDGSLKLKPVSWQATFFFYRKPNHTLYSGLARLCNEAWRAAVRPKGLQFSEPVIRLPAYIAGIASVATIALLLKELTFPSAGILAAFLSALHPWHIRYASEARAYAFVLCLVPLIVYFFLRALESGRWTWWVRFGIAEFLLVYFYPTSLYVVAVLNLCALAGLSWRWGWTHDALTQAMRLTATNVFAAMLFLPLMLPCVPQFLAYAKGTPGQGRLGPEWVNNFLAHLLAGIPWCYPGHSEADCLELYRWFLGRPSLEILAVALAILFLAAGIRRLILKGTIFSLMPVIFLAPALICFLVTKIQGLFINEWYLIFVLPGAISLVAIGVDDLAGLVGPRVGRTASVALASLVLLAYAGWTAPQRRFLTTRSIQPNRESVLLTRPSLDPKDERQRGILTATFYGPPDPYDPNIMLIHSATDLGELVRVADATGKALFVNLGYLTTVEGEHLNKYEFLKSSPFFEDLGILPGFEPTMQSRHVFHYRPGSAASFDFASIPRDRGRLAIPYTY